MNVQSMNMSGLEDKLECNLKLATYGWGGIRKLVYVTDRPTILKGVLVRLFVDGNS